MKKFCFIILIFTEIVSSQDIKVYHEKNQRDEMILYADNMNYTPVSLYVDVSFANYTKSGKDTIVLSPRKRRQKILKLQKKNKRIPSRFSYNVDYMYGDINIKEYDSLYVYNLPYSKDKKYKILQGYKGSFSHFTENNKYAIDFKMPLGTEIFAARGGIVIKVIEKFNRNCAKIECENFNNLITIMHNDGTYADYLHIRHKGSLVKEGDKIVTGQIIGFSGNTGWSSEPHLHFVVYLQKIYKRITIPTKFHNLKEEKYNF
ncbi:M23 family metallopeptidase [Zunongwangia sp. HGR-M22]|uniref:M23 family metallopeptidase n=1 Tax=Zunongwangia sp. HGR-M22 TaxID=3015168 RepID=UPI0022DE65CC|nr:M23 family metallopeptidase [Zunongwangia sp. HGR-M22]WBL27250.1 M23 family metallopeptidase [Zunongwangia sp. HGR-M22]